MKKLDISLVPQRTRHFVSGVGSRKRQLTALLVGTVVSLGSAASAQTGSTGGQSTYTLGTYGPAPGDYLAAAQGFATNIGGILSAVLGIMMLIMAVWKGPGLYMKYIGRSAKT